MNYFYEILSFSQHIKENLIKVYYYLIGIIKYFEFINKWKKLKRNRAKWIKWKNRKMKK